MPSIDPQGALNAKVPSSPLDAFDGSVGVTAVIVLRSELRREVGG